MAVRDCMFSDNKDRKTYFNQEQQYYMGWGQKRNTSWILPSTNQLLPGCRCMWQCPSTPNTVTSLPRWAATNNPCFLKRLLSWLFSSEIRRATNAVLEERVCFLTKIQGTLPPNITYSDCRQCILGIHKSIHNYQLTSLCLTTTSDMPLLACW